MLVRNARERIQAASCPARKYNTLHGVPLSSRKAEGGERAGFHAVDVNISEEMVDFMLQDARVPTVRVDRFRQSSLIHALHLNIEGAWNNRGKSRQG
jgi:hypothetical protein